MKFTKTKLIIAALAIKKVVILTMLYVASSHAEATTYDLPPLVPPIPISAGAQSFPVQGGRGFQTFGTGLPLAEFLRITLGDIARRAYVLTPEAAQSQAPISADFSRIKLKDPLPLVREVLENLGLSMREVGDVLFIERKKDTAAFKAKQSIYIYRPKHRPVGSLSSYFSLFPELKFSFNSGIATPAFTPTSESGASAPAGAGQPIASSQNSGAVAFSSTDKDPSFLVIEGTTDQIDKFKAFLVEVDIQVPEVILRAYVFEVRDASGKDSAVQLVANVLGGHLGVKFGPDPVGDSIRIGAGNISLAVGALTSDSRVHLVSSPVLRAADGTTASATIGTDTPTLGAIVTSNGSTSQSVSYQSAGVLLSISPRILDDSIRLSISQELSSFVKTDTGLGDTPTKLRRAFKSDVVARHGESILLGGLSEAQESEASRGGFLWFGSDSATKTSSQIVVLVNVERIDAHAKPHAEVSARTEPPHSPAPKLSAWD